MPAVLPIAASDPTAHALQKLSRISSVACVHGDPDRRVEAAGEQANEAEEMVLPAVAAVVASSGQADRGAVAALPVQFGKRRTIEETRSRCWSWPVRSARGSVAIRSITGLHGPACSIRIKRECELRQEF
jgi:hypothetical protein